MSIDAGDEDDPLSSIGIYDIYNVIQPQIGKGGFGQVHLVEDKKDKKQYVVKVIRGNTRDEREWAKKEIQFLKEIRHPNIVLYKEDFEIQKGVVVVMEYCNGGDLAKLIKERTSTKSFLLEPQVVDWLRQICQALQYLHSKNILHRDLKPANIFIAGGSTLKLGDFGVSRQLVSSVDVATTMVGTPLYISPEMQRQEPYNHKSDVWSAGCAIYELMAFRPPIDPMMVYMTGNWVVREMPKHYSSELCDVIKNMLTVDQTQRPSISDVLEYPILKNSRQDEASFRRKDSVEEPAKQEDVPGPKENRETDENKEVEDHPEDDAHDDDDEILEDHTYVFVVKPEDTMLPTAVYTTQDLTTTVDPNTFKKTAKERLEDFGFQFNENKQMRSVRTGEAFQYNVFRDVIENERRYKDIAKTVNEYVGDLLETDLKMSRVTIPCDSCIQVDCADSEPYTFIYATPDFLMTRDKLLILVGGGDVIRAGVWSRKVVINDSLDAGSQIPVIQQAIDEGYAVVILNQNHNQVVVDGIPFKIRDSGNPMEHALYVWDEIVIRNTKVRHIAFIAHSEGGRLVVQTAIEREEYFRRLVFAVAFCNSKHDDVLSTAPKSIVEFFKSHSRNWIANSRPLDEPISKPGFLSRKDMSKVSAGEARPEWTVSKARESVFRYLAAEYNQLPKV